MLHIVEHILNLSLGLLVLLFILLDLLVVALLAPLRLLQLPHLFEVLLLLLQVFDGLLLLGVSVRAERLRDGVLQAVVGVLQLVHGLVVPLDLLLDLLILLFEKFLALLAIKSPPINILFIKFIFYHILPQKTNPPLLRRMGLSFKTQLASGKMSKCSIGFCHLVRIFFLFESCTGFVVGINNFKR